MPPPPIGTGGIVVAHDGHQVISVHREYIIPPELQPTLAEIKEFSRSLYVYMSRRGQVITLCLDEFSCLQRTTFNIDVLVRVLMPRCTYMYLVIVYYSTDELRFKKLYFHYPESSNNLVNNRVIDAIK